MMRLPLFVVLLLLLVTGAVHQGWSAPPAQSTVAARQPAAFYRNVYLVEDTVWSGEVEIEGGVTVAPQATLTVSPGTVVRFAAPAAGRPQPLATLMVRGRLVVNGTVAQPVVLTGSGQETGVATWQGVQLVGSDKNNLLTHTRIKGAMMGIDAIFSRLTLKSVWADRCGTGIRVQDALFEAQGGIVSGCGIALHLLDAEVAVRGMQIQRNRQGVVGRRGSILLDDVECSDNEQDGIKVSGSRLNLERNRLLRNGNGLVLENVEGAVKGNRITGQRGHGATLTNARVRFRDNLVTGNALSGVVVQDGRAAAYNNALHGNGQFDLVNEGPEEFRAPGNWWGGSDPLAGRRVGGKGVVFVAPLLPQAPREM